MKANIYFNSKSKGLDYSGEGTYVLVLEETDKPVSFHLCSVSICAQIEHGQNMIL